MSGTGDVRSARLADRLTARTRREGSGAARAAASEDVTAFGERLRQAERLLAARRQSLYATPWYLVMGPPGAGKSAWLSGLGLAHDAIREGDASSPTVTCDVLVFEDAVALDVAGRLISQDLDPAADRMAWAGVLRSLLRRRPSLPLSGIIVMVPAAVLADTSDRRGILAALRLRLNEVGRTIGGRLPVYLVATKLDAVPGSFALMSTLDEDETEQVWGVTFPKPRPDDETLQAGLDDLVRRVTEQVILRQHHGLDEQAASALWLLPRDLSRLFDGAAALAGSITEGTSLLLRGIYLSAHPASVNDQRRTARAPFARALFEGVVLREAGMAARQPRRTLDAWLHLAAAPVLALALAAGLAWAYVDHQEKLQLEEATLDRLSAAVAAMTLTRITEADPMPVLPALGALDWFRHGGARPIALPYPYKAAAVRDAATIAYARGLEILLEPRLLLALEQSIVAEGVQGAATPAYLGVAVQPAQAAPWMTAWLARSPFPSLAPDAAQALAQHVALLLRSATRPLTVDGPMLARLSLPAGGRS